MILRNSKGFFRCVKCSHRQNKEMCCTLREQRNTMIETIFTYGEYHKLQSFTERIPLNSQDHFLHAYTLLGTLPPLLLTVDDSVKGKWLMLKFWHFPEGMANCTFVQQFFLASWSYLGSILHFP